MLKKICLCILLSFSFLGGPIALAETWNLDHGHIKIDGDSTLHKFYIATDKFRVDADLKGMQVNNFKMTVPVANLKSESKGLDKNMRKTLNAKDHPDITVTISSSHLLAKTGDGTYMVKAKGQMVIGGVTKPIELDATAKPDAGDLHVAGDKKILMSDFKLKPPTIMGFIKTADELKIHYDFDLKKGEVAK